MTPCEGLIFVWFFFELVTSDLRPTWNDDARKLPLAPRKCGVSFSPHLFSEEMTYCEPKNDFCKKSGGLLFSAKVQNHSVLAKSAETYAKFKNNLRRLPQWNESSYAYSRWSNIYMWCFSQLLFSRFRSRFTKKPYFGTLKMEKVLFVGRNENRPPWRSSPSRRPCACPIWPCSDKLCHAQSRI
jgi:hypothetical protein